MSYSIICSIAKLLDLALMKMSNCTKQNRPQLTLTWANIHLTNISEVFNVVFTRIMNAHFFCFRCFFLTHFKGCLLFYWGVRGSKVGDGAQAWTFKLLQLISPVHLCFCPLVASPCRKNRFLHHPISVLKHWKVHKYVQHTGNKWRSAVTGSTKRDCKHHHCTCTIRR